MNSIPHWLLNAARGFRISQSAVVDNFAQHCMRCRGNERDIGGWRVLIIGDQNDMIDGIRKLVHRRDGFRLCSPIGEWRKDAPGQ